MPLLQSPTEFIDGDDRDGRPQDGIALCLSGGGYRAMLFHVGALWRLYELEYLPLLKRVSSVSGGSITAAVLGLNWLSLKAGWTAAAFQDLIVRPIRGLSSHTIDLGAVFGGFLLPGSISDRVADAYRDHLFGRRTLQDLPSDAEGPRFVINATSVQTGALWRFSKPFAADYLVGEVRNPTIELAIVVAASSAFPPVLSPARITLPEGACRPLVGSKLHRPPYTTDLVLTDGGVYDNLGLETAWKRYASVLVSDGGGKTAPEEDPATDWAFHAVRVLDLIDNQVRSLRKRQLIASYQLPDQDQDHRAGTYWGIRTNIADYHLPNALSCPIDQTTALANIPTRLEAMDDRQQERLINWGYAVCDAAMRKHVFLGAPAPHDFPYPAAKVG